jgi:phosphoadenosine phosphosulfate reductase
MRYVIFEETIEELKRMAAMHEACAVSFSGGKDSLVCLDLCLRVFTRMVPFFLYFIPGLVSIEAPVEKYAAHFGVTVARYPHWIFFQNISDEIYCDSNYRFQQAQRLRQMDVFNAMRAEHGIKLIVSGVKASDGPMRRRRLFADQKSMDDHIIYPIKRWLKYDVLAYIKMRGIPMPEIGKKVSGGVDLSTPSLLSLHDNDPEDFARVERFFPYVRAVVERRRMYGVA